MAQLLFKGSTAVVTGAGGGLGRQYALMLAARGASVVVNDVGGSLDGSASPSSTAAQAVVDEILAGHGKAVANYDNVVTGSQAILDQAMHEFGGVDILINNAGILRDKSFHKSKKEDWDAVIDVHLHGTANLCREVWPHMMEAKAGKIVNIGSAAGLYGNFGQSNYSAAKMGILGLTNTLAEEGKKHNISVNCVCPIAASRMTETVGLPKAVLNLLEPEHVAPFVVYLAHPDTKISGKIYEVGGGWYSEVKWARSAGVTLGSAGSPASIEAIRDNMAAVGDFGANSTFPSSPSDAFKSMMAAKARGAFSSIFGG